MSNYVTTHDSNAKGIFSSNVAEKRPQLPTPIGNMEILYTTHQFPMNVTADQDIDTYNKDAREGLGFRLCPEGGTATAILNIEPGCDSRFHRTMTLDVFVVMEGVLELELDSGERRTLKAGDSVTQRAVMHKWTNVTPNNGWAKAIAIAQPITQPLEIAGKNLETEFLP